MDIPNEQLRDFILDTFDDDELDEFCFVYFPDAEYEFGQGMSRRKKTLALIKFADRRGKRQHLLVALGKERSELFLTRFGSLTQPPAAPPSATTRLNRRVFISYALEDAALARRLADALRAAGRSVWIAPDNVLPGEQWGEAIRRGIDISGIYVVLVTPEAVASEWVNYEMALAVNLERQLRMEIVPLDIAPAKPPAAWLAYPFLPFRDYGADLPGVLARLAARRPVGQAPRVGPRLPLPDPPTRASVRLSRQTATGSQRPADPPATPPVERPADALPVVMPTETPTATSLKPTYRIHATSEVTLIYVPAGVFLFGPDRRTVKLEEYWIGRYPVTNAQYRNFLRANPAYPAPFVDADWARPFNWNRETRDFAPGRGEHPVVLVRWADARAYCDWAGLRLPTEEEWEKAARGKDGRLYPWGDASPSPELCNFGRAYDGPTVVGRFSPRGDSPFGCGDVAGNVAEWVDGRTGAAERRVLRGGAWSLSVDYIQTTSRLEVIAEHPLTYAGFRVATADPTGSRFTAERRTHAQSRVEFVRVPAGQFFFGDNRQPVMLPAYWIGRYEVTNIQFERFARATGYLTTAERKGYGRVWRGGQWVRQDGASWRQPDGPGSSIADKAMHPVVQVSLADAEAFCRWAGLRLPTEQEWEKAARGSDSRVFPWGNEPPSTERLNYNRRLNGTTPVGAYSPRGDSAFGLADMAGNVWEWTTTSYDKEPGLLVLKGGSWADPESSWLRGAAGPNHSQGSIGFRVVIDEL